MISNVMYISVNKQLTGCQNCFGVLSQALPGNGLKDIFWIPVSWHIK